jgi:hypothetical protein
MWDETAERITVTLPAGHTKLTESSAWDVCVSRMRIAWGWILDSGHIRSYFMDLVSPPIYLLTNSSKHIYNGMQRHPVLKGLVGFKTSFF